MPRLRQLLMNKDKFINLALRYGGIVVLLAALIDVYSVMRYRELFSKSLKSREAASQAEMDTRKLQALLQEFAQRAASDTTIMQILQRAQQRTAASATVPAAPTP